MCPYPSLSSVFPPVFLPDFLPEFLPVPVLPVFLVPNPVTGRPTDSCRARASTLQHYQTAQRSGIFFITRGSATVVVRRQPA